MDTRKKETSQRTDNITEEEVEGSPRMRSLSLKSLWCVEFYCLEIFLVFFVVLPMGLFDFWGEYECVQYLRFILFLR